MQTSKYLLTSLALVFDQIQNENDGTSQEAGAPPVEWDRQLRDY